MSDRISELLDEHRVMTLELTTLRQQVDAITAERDTAQDEAQENWQSIKRLKAEVEALTAENARLRDWKESALQSLARWHALGDDLQIICPMTVGDDIPTVLRNVVRPSYLAALSRAEAAESRFRTLTEALRADAGFIPSED